MNKNRIFGVLSAVIGILLLIGLFSFAATCPVAAGDMPMKCHWTGRALEGLGVVIVIAGLLKVFIKEPLTIKGIAMIEALIGIYGMAVLTVLIGTCMKMEMQCNVITRPYVLLLLIIYVVLAIINVAMIQRDHKLDGSSSNLDKI